MLKSMKSTNYSVGKYQNMSEVEKEIDIKSETIQTYLHAAFDNVPEDFWDGVLEDRPRLPTSINIWKNYSLNS